MIFPEYDYEMDIEGEDLLEDEYEADELSSTLGRTPLFDFNKGRYVFRDGKVVECTQDEAIRQWIGFLIKTPADQCEVYDETDFGTYIYNLLGQKSMAFVAAEIQRELNEKCPNNRAINSLEDFEISRENGSLHIKFTIIKNVDEEYENETETVEVSISV